MSTDRTPVHLDWWTRPSPQEDLLCQAEAGGWRVCSLRSQHQESPTCCCSQCPRENIIQTPTSKTSTILWQNWWVNLGITTEALLLVRTTHASFCKMCEGHYYWQKLNSCFLCILAHMSYFISMSLFELANCVLSVNSLIYSKTCNFLVSLIVNGQGIHLRAIMNNMWN